jgi:pilus assembly protein CpaF
LSELVRNSLRMRPDRLVVGEVRGAEIADLLAAMNTGHEGGCGTVHANSAADVPARLEALAALSGMDRASLHSQLASAVQAVIHMARDAHGRRRVLGVFMLQRDEASGLVRVCPGVQFPEHGGLAWGPAGHRLRELLQ